MVCKKNYILVIVLLLCTNGLTSTSIQEKWNQFKEKYGKNYTDEEDKSRFKVFEKNVKIIEEHNTKFAQNLVTYETEINKFTDMEPSEFLSKSSLKVIEVKDAPVFRSLKGRDVPDSFDWREKGEASKVKNQGNCGSCWSFVVTGTLEWLYFLENNKTVSLSEQNLIDCTKNYQNMNGCKGGTFQGAYMYVKDKGISTDGKYPYKGIDTESCKFESNQSVLSIAGYTLIPKNEVDLKNAVATIEPVAAAIDASYLQYYKGGIFYHPSCSSTNLNHGVVVVGYGTKDGTDYWIAKNSWDKDWGENGYFRMARNRDNHCGIVTQALYPNYRKSPNSGGNSDENSATSLTLSSVLLFITIPFIYLSINL